MIEYGSTLYLFRIQGSAVYKVLFPAAISTLFLALLEYLTDWHGGYNAPGRLVKHPYAIGALIAFFSFLLTFRLNYAYGRYWDAATSVHKMLSKWLDAAMTLAAFHYQSSLFSDMRPDALGQHPKLQRIKPDRHFHVTLEQTVENIQGSLSNRPTNQRPWWRRLFRKDDITSRPISPTNAGAKSIVNTKKKTGDSAHSDLIPIPLRFQEKFDIGKRQSPRSSMVKQRRAFLNLSDTRTSQFKMPPPSLFLQEMAHLFSLLAAIAMATLRNDNPCAEVPVTEYIPGKRFPPVDPDALSRDIRREYESSYRILKWLYFCLGISRTQKQRTLYNAARPFAVLGGVSDEEIRQLFEANGPYAKVALCTMWLQEFMTREHLAGSTGATAPPIISRLYQYISDGMTGYNEARKVAYTPFPFPHSQITALFSFIIVFLFPLLMVEFVLNMKIACVLNFAVVLCFLGVHEVARELESPFQNMPNDLPLTTFQAQFNEALITVYAGYHPDSWETKRSEEDEVKED